MDQEKNAISSDSDDEFNMNVDFIKNEGKADDQEKPKKGKHRMRAHINPLTQTDKYLLWDCPDQIDWNLFQALSNIQSQDKTPSILDIGCGFGGLLFALSKKFPDKLCLGMEIRGKVCNQVHKKIHQSRKEESTCQNSAVLQTNSMRFLLNQIGKDSLDQLFICFPDPHFKNRKKPWRIIQNKLLTEQAQVIKPGKLLCHITDVKDQFEFADDKICNHGLFQKLNETEHDELLKEIIQLMKTSSEEAMKVNRNGGSQYQGLYRRI